MAHIYSKTYRRQKNTSEQVLAAWLHTIASWQLAVTLTIESRDPVTGYPVDRERIAKAVRYFLARLNKAVFGHAAVRHQHRVASVFVIEHGASGDHPHVHMTLSRPSHVTLPELQRQVKRLVLRNSLFRREHAIRTYTSANWHDYCLKHGVDRLVAEQIETANP